MNPRADCTPCKVIHSFNTNIENNTSRPLGVLLKRIAWTHSNNIPSNATILDVSGLLGDQDPGLHHYTALQVEQNPGLNLYTLWICPVSTPAIFSTSCACEHIRRHLRSGAKMIVTLFNDLGGEENGVVAEPGTYLIALKKIDEEPRCVPVNFSSQEKAAIKFQKHCMEPSAGQDVVGRIKDGLNIELRQ
jgi:hypothetical protein